MSYQDWPPADAYEPQPPSFAEAAPAPRRRSGLVIAAAVVVVLALTLGSGVGLGWALARVFLHPVASGPLGVLQNGLSAQNPAAGSLAAVESAVVDIDTTVSGGGRAAGTGILLTSDGEVLTNNHVIAGATTISVSVQGHDSAYQAVVLGEDPSADVALLKLSGASSLPTARTAGAAATTGTHVVALGNALGQGGPPSVTEGTVLALDQSITASEDNGTSERLSGLIESDAPISPGDSGGALVNSRNEVIGMITAGQTSGFRSQTSTIGYAVPIGTAMAVVRQIRTGHGTSQVFVGAPGYIGVHVRDLDAEAAAQLGLSGVSGVLVTGVESGSPAEQAGLVANSVITAINGTPTPDTTSLGNAIHVHHPGDQLTVAWTDASGSHSGTLTLTTGPAI